MRGLNIAPVTLKTLRRDLEHWRGTRKKSGSIPEHIWKQAISLLSNNTKAEICRELRFTHSEVNKKIKKNDPFTIKTDTPFYEVAIPSIKHQQTDIKLGASIEIKRPDGTLVNIKHLSELALMNLISSLIRSH